MPSPVAYDPAGTLDGCPPDKAAGWPWVVVKDLTIRLPDHSPIKPLGAGKLGYMALFDDQLWLRGGYNFPFRSDGPTGCPLWLKLWLMARWPEAFLAHDALVQVTESLPKHQAREFRRWADRMMRELIQPICWRCNSGRAKDCWSGYRLTTRLTAFTVRWLAYGAVRAWAGVKGLRG